MGGLLVDHQTACFLGRKQGGPGSECHGTGAFGVLLIGNFQGAHRPKPGRTAFSLFFFQLNEIQLMEDLISPSGLQGKRDIPLLLKMSSWLCSYQIRERKDVLML